MTSLNIRPAVIADVPEILALINELAVYEKLAHEVVATEELLAENLFGASPKAFAVMAERDGKVAGFALCFYNFSTFLGRPGIYLEDLYVRPEFRSQGIGKSLLKHIAARAVAEGCGRFEWWVLDWNEPAINVYKNIGARPMDEWTVFRLDGQALSDFAGI